MSRLCEDSGYEVSSLVGVEFCMKKLMLLGGSRYLLPVIETAHKLGVYVITCDYLPDNIAHKFSEFPFILQYSNRLVRVISR